MKAISFIGTVNTVSDLPANANEGEYYVAVDTSLVYVYANGAWNEVLQSAGSTQGENTVDMEYQLAVLAYIKKFLNRAEVKYKYDVDNTRAVIHVNDTRLTIVIGVDNVTCMPIDIYQIGVHVHSDSLASYREIEVMAEEMIYRISDYV
jgi:hypothetical protein